jgi:hypothetical protein
MNGNEDGTQGKNSGTDLNQEVILKSPPELCACTCRGLWNVRDCGRAGQEPRGDEHDQADHDAPRVRDLERRLRRSIPGGFLAGMDGVGNLQVAVVLNMEQPTITDFVYHPNRLSVVSPLVH